MLVGVAITGCVPVGKSSKLVAEPTVNVVIGVVDVVEEPVAVAGEYPEYVLISPTGKTYAYVLIADSGG